MQAVSYWCLPDETSAAAFDEIIAGLAEAQGAPRFVPHLTLATLAPPADDPGAVIKALRGLELTPLKRGGTADFTTSLFIRFRASPGLLEARALMEALPGFRPGRPFDPHISLCYGPPPDLAPWQSRLGALLQNPVRFDRLAEVSVTPSVTSYADVAAWTLMKVHAL